MLTHLFCTNVSKLIVIKLIHKFITDCIKITGIQLAWRVSERNVFPKSTWQALQIKYTGNTDVSLHLQTCISNFTCVSCGWFHFTLKTGGFQSFLIQFVCKTLSVVVTEFIKNPCLMFPFPVVLLLWFCSFLSPHVFLESGIDHFVRSFYSSRSLHLFTCHRLPGDDVCDFLLLFLDASLLV